MRRGRREDGKGDSEKRGRKNKEGQGDGGNSLSLTLLSLFFFFLLLFLLLFLPYFPHLISPSLPLFFSYPIFPYPSLPSFSALYHSLSLLSLLSSSSLLPLSYLRSFFPCHLFLSFLLLLITPLIGMFKKILIKNYFPPRSFHFHSLSLPSLPRPHSPSFSHLYSALLTFRPFPSFPSPPILPLFLPLFSYLFSLPVSLPICLLISLPSQARQTRPNSGGVAEGHPRFDKVGVTIIFLLFTL